MSDSVRAKRLAEQVNRESIILVEREPVNNPRQYRCTSTTGKVFIVYVQSESGALFSYGNSDEPIYDLKKVKK